MLFDGGQKDVKFKMTTAHKVYPVLVSALNSAE